jgi:hypothetical protein
MWRRSVKAPRDGTHVLTIYIVLLFALPSKLVIGPLGGAGAPANVFACGCLLWWVLRQLSQSRSAVEPEPTTTTVRPRPVRAMMLVFCLLVLASYIASMTRSTTETELNSADTALILMAGWLGLVLMAGDAFTSLDGLHKLVRRIAVGVGIVALIGILQFFTGLTLVDVIQIPGLKVNNGGVASLEDRQGFTRVAGTTINPIEFGVVVGSMLPLCLHSALTDTGMRAVRWLPVVCVAIAIPLSISRSALIAVGVALAILFVTWDRRMRVAAAAGVLVVAGGVFVVIPGMLGTLSGLFTGVQDDSSALSRTDSYALALDFVGRSPWIGRGFLTFLPEYRTLDNQYLGLLIDLGLLGTGALVTMFAVAIAYGIYCRCRVTDPRTRSLLVSMIAALSASAVSFAFFDALSFPMIAGLTFLLIGMIDSLGRYLHAPVQRARPRPLTRDLGLPSAVHSRDEEHLAAETLAPASRFRSV